MTRASAGPRHWLRLALCAIGAGSSCWGAPSAWAVSMPRDEPRAQYGPACFTLAFVPEAGVAALRLPRGFLRAGSDSVWTRSLVWQRQRDYRFDLLRGDLRLLRTTAPGETVWVKACGLVNPPALEYVRQVYRPAGSVANAAGTPGSARPANGDSLGLGASPRPGTARSGRRPAA